MRDIFLSPPWISMDQAASSTTHSPLRRIRSDGVSYIPPSLSEPSRRARISYDDHPRGLTVLVPTPSHTAFRSASASPPPLRPRLDLNVIPSRPVLPGGIHFRRSPRQRVLAFFGYGDDPEVRARKDLVRLLWNWSLNGAQARS